MIDRANHGLNVGVVGGGLAGLAAACVLAARGHKVTLFEKNRGWVAKQPSTRTKGFGSIWDQPF